eukprot:gb/GEZN01008559.1/.p1 GENE.gb/GEZN01008559.1/~~gb/GEZN01008559.1/.p1  ORF type:complete len:327 (+),score=53.11 gb/GEZN01008559.1/:81-1061(+)
MAKKSLKGKEDWVLTKPEKKSLLGSAWIRQYLKVKEGKFSFSDNVDSAPNRFGEVMGVRVLESNREQKEGIFLWKIYYHNPATLHKESMKQSMKPVLVKSEKKSTRKEWLAAFSGNGATVDNITLLEGNLTYLGTSDSWKPGKKHPKPLYGLVYKGVLQLYKTRKDWSEYNPTVEVDLLKGSAIKNAGSDAGAVVFELTDHFGLIHVLAATSAAEADKWIAAIKKCIFETPNKKLNISMEAEAAPNPTAALASPVRENQFFTQGADDITLPEEMEKLEGDKVPNSPKKDDSTGPPVHFRGASFDLSSMPMSPLGKSSEPGTATIAE